MKACHIVRLRSVDWIRIGRWRLREARLDDRASAFSVSARHGIMPAVILCLALCAPAGDFNPTEEDRWAILLAGISGDSDLQKEYLEQLKSLRGMLIGPMRLASDRIFVLVDDPAAVPDMNPLRATRDNLALVVGRIATLAKPEHQVFFFITGHGSSDGTTYRLNLVGRDPTGDELAAMIYGIPARRHVIVNTTSCSGASLEPLSGPGKIVVTATRSGQERNLTRMGRYFVAAFKDNAADADKNGRVSILEAFNYASRRVEDYYNEEGSLQTEHPMLDDNGDGKAHAQPSPENGDGLLAGNAYLDAAATAQAESGMSAEERMLAAAARDLERQIEALKYAKPGMAEAEYEKQLESLLVKLAEVNAKLRKR